MHPLLTLLLVICFGFLVVTAFKFSLYVRLSPEPINWRSWDAVFRGYVKFWNEIPTGASEISRTVKINPFVIHAGGPTADLTRVYDQLEEQEEKKPRSLNELI